MKSVLNETRDRMKKTLEVFDSTVATVRTGRANPAILNRIHVDYYGASTPLNQLATVSSPDPRTLVITPFDKSIVADVERAIQEGDLGFNPNNQGDNIFINVPQLNDERRRDLVRMVKNMAEEARIALRSIRQDANKELKDLEGENLLTRDDLRLGETEVQKLIDEFTAVVEGRVKDKETDIMAV